MSAEEFIGALDTVEALVGEVQPDRLETVIPILHEMRFCAWWNAQFRKETSEQLQELLEELYAKTQDD
jgi:hypothetical protein